MKLTPLAKSLGVTLQELALQLRYRVYGQEVMRLQRGRDEVRVFVRYPENDRRSVAALSELGIRTRTGSSIPLGKLVTWKYKRQLKVVRRVDRKRLATVFSNLDDTRGNRQEIVTSLRKSVLPAVVKLAPAVKVEFAGQGKEQAKVFGGMKFALPIALFAILVLLVAVFRSYVQAGIIMIMIVFGLIGAVLGHMILGMPVTILSFFGVVGLAGIVVNDSLVLMDSVNRHIEEGYAIHDAAWLAGQSRLRAILSTTLTTFVGLMPLIAEKSLQAQFLIPMAISVAFGVLFATVITLIMVPSYFLITNDLRRIRYWIWNGVWVTPEIVDPTAKRLREEKEREEMEEEVEEDKKKAASGGGHGSSGGSLGGGHGSHPQGPLHHPPAGHYPPGHGAPTPGHPVSPVPPTGDYPQPSFSTPPNPHR